MMPVFPFWHMRCLDGLLVLYLGHPLTILWPCWCLCAVGHWYFTDVILSSRTLAWFRCDCVSILARTCKKKTDVGQVTPSTEQCLLMECCLLSWRPFYWCACAIILTPCLWRYVPDATPVPFDVLAHHHLTHHSCCLVRTVQTPASLQPI